MIFPENQAVLFVVYRIIRFFPLFKIIGIFIGDDGRTLFAELKVLVFDDTGIRSFAVGIVHDCIALKVFYIREVPVFESQAAVFQMSACIVEVFVYAAGVEHLLRQSVQLFAVRHVIGSGAHLDVLQQGTD